MQCGHVPPVRLEGDSASEPIGLPLIFKPEPYFHGGNDQGGLRGIALNRIVAVFLIYARFVAEHPDAQYIAEFLELFIAQEIPLVKDVAVGFIPASRYFIGMFSVEDDLYRHLIFCERPGLVRADHGGAPQCLDGGELSDDCVPLRHPPYADCHRYRDNDRQPFGYGGHRGGHGDFKKLHYRDAEEQSQQADYHGAPQHQEADELGKPPDLLLERRLNLSDAFDVPGDPTEYGL